MTMGESEAYRAAKTALESASVTLNQHEHRCRYNRDGRDCEECHRLFILYLSAFEAADKAFLETLPAPKRYDDESYE